MKRVLIICYYWPPAGGPGVQRWLKFVKYFKEFGIDPVVYVPENAHYPLQDKSLETEVPQDITILKQPTKEPYRFAKWLSGKKTQQISSGIITHKNPSLLEKLMLFVRGNLFIPDARVGWVKPSVKFLEVFIANNNIDAVVTTGPPHSLHLIGLKLKRKCTIGWIADFRDPWTTIHYHKSLRLTKISEKKHKKLEAEVLNTADLVVVTSPTTQKEFRAITSKRIEVITNGFDTSENITANLDTKFSLVHIGSLLNDRNPLVLWKLIAEMVVANAEFKRALHIKLVGAVGDEILETLKDYGLSQFCEISGYVSHAEALQIQHNAQLLLLVEMDRPETKAIIPGKLFEYMRAKRPILAMGPEGSDIKELIEETQSGEFMLYTEEERLKSYLLHCFENYQNGTVHMASSNVINYSRRSLTKKMASLLKKL